MLLTVRYHRVSILWLRSVYKTCCDFFASKTCRKNAPHSPPSSSVCTVIRDYNAFHRLKLCVDQAYGNALVSNCMVVLHRVRLVLGLVNLCGSAGGTQPNLTKLQSLSTISYRPKAQTPLKVTRAQQLLRWATVWPQQAWAESGEGCCGRLVPCWVPI